MAFPLVQLTYWIALATWFGGVLFIAIAAPVLFLSVNLEGQHCSLRAGTIVANLIATLVHIELICAAALLFALIGQWFVTDTRGDAYLLPLLRSAMYLAAVGF